MQLAPVPHSFLEHFFTFGPQVFQARPVLSLAQPGVDHSSNDLDCFLGENGTLKTGSWCCVCAYCHWRILPDLGEQGRGMGDPQ